MMMKQLSPLRQILLFTTSLAAAGAVALHAHAQALLPQSKINITFKQMGVSVDAAFNKFNATIQYDPKQPAAAKANFTIEINSFDLGSPDYNKEVLKPEWFDAPKFPTATFVSSSMKAISPGQLEATGKLTIKGKSQDITFPVAVKETGETRNFEGTVRIKRLTFDIGTGEWKDTSMVADEVMIKVLASTKK